MKKELICRTCGGKRFIQRSFGINWQREEITEDYECKRCEEWIRINYAAKHKEKVKK